MKQEVLPDWKKVHPLSERLVFLGIMEARLRDPLETPQYDSAMMVRGVSWRSLVSYHDAERRQSREQLYVSSLMFFQSARVI